MNRLLRAALLACLPCLVLLAGPARAGEAPTPGASSRPIASAPLSLPAPTASQVQAGFRTRQLERERLQAERQSLARDYAAERAGCMHRFQVFACLDQAATRHRRLDRALAERQRKLDLLDREQRAEQERERVRANLAARARDEALRAAHPRPPAALAPSAPARMPARPVVPAPRAARQPLQSASEARAARSESQQREQSYERLRQRAQAQQGSQAPALPVPPASGPLRAPR
ncbi:hypothetical protein [Thiomonas sp.]|jgi:hypothetical protein|uniref:hypothetical protein n=1 Tax=Thiomonas sp. TaxID=2047785 RepID=UPI002624EB30|nr:hypothetical protein [Thiomonas sp.]